jgi:uncharacterized membrane protein
MVAMFEQRIHVDAPAADVWAVMSDVARWPEWTASVRRVQPLDPGRSDSRPLAVGQRFRVEQPKLPTVVWEVTDVRPERAFAWTARAPGVTSVAVHEIEPAAGGGVDVRLAIEQRGALAPLVRVLLGSRTRRYMSMEAAGLKARAEARE